MSEAKSKRQKELSAILATNPFLTDEELSKQLYVSQQTIRLDRLEMGIPELRIRALRMAENTYSQLRNLANSEIVGELYDLDVGKHAFSLLKATEDMVFKKSRVVRGHYIYAQAESLAIAVVNADVVVTGVANIKYKQPVYVNDRVVAKAELTRQRGNKYFVAVRTRRNNEEVFRAKMILVSLT